jgi:hypothetical protein
MVGWRELPAVTELAERSSFEVELENDVGETQ